LDGVRIKDVIELRDRALVVVDEDGREKYYVARLDEARALLDLVGDVIVRPEHWTLLSDEWIPHQ